jgi:hypothetical protein
MESPVEFLTVEECHQVDAALLTSREKFTSRVAIYALRSLKTIAIQENCAIKELSQETVVGWIHSDPSLQETQDGNFRSFFSQIVLSAIRPLQAIASNGENDGTIENVTVAQLISHYEAQAKANL